MSMKPTTQIKTISKAIVECSPANTSFEAGELAQKVQIILGEFIPEWFTESYDSRPLHTKAETICEFNMKQMEIDGIVSRVAPRTWAKKPVT